MTLPTDSEVRLGMEMLLSHQQRGRKSEVLGEEKPELLPGNSGPGREGKS